MGFGLGVGLSSGTFGYGQVWKRKRLRRGPCMVIPSISSALMGFQSLLLFVFGLASYNHLVASVHMKTPGAQVVPRARNSRLQVVVQVLEATTGHLDGCGMWWVDWTATARGFQEQSAGRLLARAEEVSVQSAGSSHSCPAACLDDSARCVMAAAATGCFSLFSGASFCAGMFEKVDDVDARSRCRPPGGHRRDLVAEPGGCS